MALITQKGKYLSDLYLDYEAGIAPPAPPATLYLALLTTMPTHNDGTAMVEVTGTGYARQPITSAMWAAITTAGDNVTEQSSTNAQVAFASSGSNWGTVVGVALLDALSAGHLWRYGELNTPLAVNEGYIVSFAAGSLTRSEA